MPESLQLVKKYIRIFSLFFLTFQLSRLYFIIYNADLFEGNILKEWIMTAFHGFRLDLSASAYCIALFLIMWLLEEIFKRKFVHIQKILLVFTFVLIILITAADAELFRKWGNKFNSQVMVYVSHPIEMALSTGAINWFKTLTFISILVWLSGWIYKGILKELKQITIKHKTNYLFICILATINFLLLRGGIGVTAISQSAAIYSDKSINNASAVNSLWNSLYYVITNSENIYGDKLNYMSQQEASFLFKQQLREEPDSTALFSSKKPNILIVMLESFTANASLYFTGKNNCTPYLDSIAKQGVSFLNCYSSGDRTEKGLVSVLSGYPAQPSSSIIVFPDKMGQLPSLSRELKKDGYNSLFIYGGDAEFASMKSYLIVQQFDEIFDKGNFKSTELSSKWGAHDEFLYIRSLSKLNSIKKPFLTTIMTLSSHEPFDVPFNDQKLKKDEWYGLKNSIEYADKCLFTFIENCKKEPWYEETIIILVADHGHDIGLKNVHYFGPEKYHIPMIITGGALKKEFKGMRVMNYVSQTIIPELVLSQMGLPAENFNWQTNALNENGFAQYHFNNGFGRVSMSGKCIFDNDAGRCYSFIGNNKDSSLLLNEAKAFQQELVKDFLSK